MDPSLDQTQSAAGPPETVHSESPMADADGGDLTLGYDAATVRTNSFADSDSALTKTLPPREDASPGDHGASTAPQSRFGNA